jgi:tetratricopeptide (TPR) repeat protein
MKRRDLLSACACALVAVFLPSFTSAAEDPAVKAAVLHLQRQWEHIKFNVAEGPAQTELMNILGDEADSVAVRYPDQVDVLIWNGVITSERASMANPLTALGLAKRARDILEKAYKMSPSALESGATVSLAVLYYRVPGFPIGFGDKAKARQLLEQAVATAPNGLDALYFFGDFLYSQGEYARAKEVFQRALALPPHPQRPDWDRNRRLVIEEVLLKIKGKS